jgi:hypothetical protein
MRRLVRFVVALAAVGLVAAPAVIANDNSSTVVLAQGGAGGSLGDSPASACLTANDPAFSILGFDYMGSVHENTLADRSLHIVANLNLTFTVRDTNGVTILWQGTGSVAIDNVVPLNPLPDGTPIGIVSTTVPVVMAAADGRTVPTNWTIQVDGFVLPEGLFYGIGWLPEWVTCS